MIAPRNDVRGGDDQVSAHQHARADVDADEYATSDQHVGAADRDQYHSATDGDEHASADLDEYARAITDTDQDEYPRSVPDAHGRRHVDARTGRDEVRTQPRLQPVGRRQVSGARRRCDAVQPPRDHPSEHRCVRERQEGRHDSGVRTFLHGERLGCRRDGEVRPSRRKHRWPSRGVQPQLDHPVQQAQRVAGQFARRPAGGLR